MRVYSVRPLPPASRPRRAACSFSLLPKLKFVHPALRALPRVRGRGGITTLGALCVLLKRWTAACQKGSFAAF